MKANDKKTTRRRITAIMLIFTLFASYLLFNIFRLDYLKYDYYRDKTYDQVTTSSALTAYGKTSDEADSSIRISISHRNTKEDIDALCEGLRLALSKLARKK